MYAMEGTCIWCDCELKGIDNYDYELDCDTVRVYFTGYCPKCGRVYNWTEIYTFAQCEDYREVIE